MSLFNDHGARGPDRSHPFAVTSIVVYPTRQPKAARPVPVPREIPEVEVAAHNRPRDLFALWHFLRRDALR